MPPPKKQIEKTIRENLGLSAEDAKSLFRRLAQVREALGDCRPTAREECCAAVIGLFAMRVEEVYKKHPEWEHDDRGKESQESIYHLLAEVLAVLDQYSITRKGKVQ